MSSILITGAGGYIGSELIKRLVAGENFGAAEHSIIWVDIRDIAPTEKYASVTYELADIRETSFQDIVERYKPHTIVHLASVVSAGGDPDMDYSIDVLGTENVLKSCIASGVEHLIITSSGAAYGYYADNPEWLSESDALRGNDDFAYSKHKRMVEELLAKYRIDHPELKQLVLRPGTVLGATTNNQITKLFERPFILNVAASNSAFVFIWDRDVISIIEKGIRDKSAGIYNLAGDGALNSAEIAAILGKPRLTVPAWLLGALLNFTRFLGLGKLGAEHVKFLQYRPRLSNKALKDDFGYTPKKTTREVFEYFLDVKQQGKPT